jgi:hypothetical protein
VLVSALALACGPPGLSSSVGEGSTSEVGTDSSTGEGTETSTSTSTTTTETGDPSTTESETWSFVPGFDVWTEQDCDMYEQDCPDGEKCVPYGSTGGGWDAYKCVPILGDQAPGEPCTYGGVLESTDDCDATSLCWDVMDVDGEPIGTCMAICTGTVEDPECPPKSDCLIRNFNYNVCIPTCDPIIQDCGEGLACFWANYNFNCIFTTDDIPAGEPCSFINDCAAGLSCLTAEVLPGCEGSACCSGYCDLNLGDGACEALLPGTVCVSFFEEGMAPSGYEHVGVCILPP